MKRESVVLLVFLAVFLSSIQSYPAVQCPGDAMPNGWCWPTGTSDIGNYLGWHGINFGFSGNHLAQDIDADEGVEVYSMYDGGVVIKSRNNVSYYGGATCNPDDSTTSIPGGGVVVRYMNSDNQFFDILYAHLKNVLVSEGDTVNADTKIGEVCSYIWCGSRMDHLHLGVRFPANDDSNLWAGYGSSDKGFVDPMEFFQTHSPYIPIPTNYRFVSDQGVSIAWAPADVPCDKASTWAYNETCSAEYSNPGTCQLAYDELKDIDFWKYNGDDWNTIFFGSISDFQNLCY